MSDKKTNGSGAAPQKPKGKGVAPQKVNEYKTTVAKSAAEKIENAPQENMPADAIRKALKPYSDNLPYNRDRVIEETKFFLKHQVIARYEAGRRLILLLEQEADHVFGQILEDHFPGLGRRTAYNYMLYSRKIADLPKLRDFAEGNGNFKKCLALLESHDDEELAALEAGESVAGMKLDDVAKMSFREVKIALRAEKDKNAQGRDQLIELEKENEGLSKALAGARAPAQLKDQDVFKELLKIRINLGGLLTELELVDIRMSPDVANELLATYEFMRREINTHIIEQNQQLEALARELGIEIDPIIGAEMDIWYGDGAGAHVREMKHDLADHQAPQEIPTIEEHLASAEGRSVN